MNAAGVLKQKTAKDQIRSISSTIFSIEGPDSFENSVALSARWMRSINSAVPKEATTGAEFEVGGGGHHPARAVKFVYDKGSIWSSTIDNPDSTVLGRTWITEITIVKHLDQTHFGARLLNITRRIDDPFVPSIPNVVRDIISRLPCNSSGARLLENPTIVNNDTELDWLIELIESPSRRLPVLLMAEACERPALLDFEALSRRLCGAAHLVGVSRDQAKNLRRYTGREFAIIDGAVRMFRPGFKIEEADPYSHPLWIPSIDRTNAWAMPTIISRVLAISVSKGSTDYPRFQVVRQRAAEATLRGKKISSSDAEMAKLYEQENEALRNQLQDLSDEQDQWLSDAEIVRRNLEREVSELKNENYKYKLQNEAYRLKSDQSNSTKSRPQLLNLSEFGDWAQENLSNKVWIAPKAIREMEKNTDYKDPTEIGAALYFLDDIYTAMRSKSDGVQPHTAQQKLNDLGMSISACFSQSGDIKN